MSDPLTLVYLPTAVALGALHALEPGHAKTLTAAYLIGVKGTRRDAILLGLSVAATHSIVVIALAIAAVHLGREAFTDQATYWLQIASGVIVVLLGSWMLWRRWPRARTPRPAHEHGHGHEHGNHARCEHDDGAHEHLHAHDHGAAHDDLEHDHDSLDEIEHARAHAAAMPEYVAAGQRPTVWQIIAFGSAGGLIPCPASITVMLLALSMNERGLGILAVLGFSLGLAVSLVGIGLLVVMGLTRMSSTGRFSWLTRRASLISAAMVVFSGVFALLFAR